jgi:hypothetical protein
MSQPPVPTPPRLQPAGSSQRPWLALIPVLGGILLLLIAVIVVVAIVIRSLLPSEEIPGTELPVTRIPATPTSPTSPVTPPSTGCQTIIGSDDVRIAASFPLSLTVGEMTFPVEVVVPDETGWSFPADSPGAAAWVCGTVVNYVLELESTTDNEALLASLRPGDEITLHLSSSVALVFQFAERREGVKADDAAVFQQFEPRLTLLLREGSSTWKVTTANYLAQTRPSPPPATGPLVSLGQPARVDSAQVTVLRGYALAGDTLPVGMMYYLVEFSVENVGAATLNADAFDMQLQDGVGNVYLLSPAASALGAGGLLSGQIPSGTTAKGAAGYVVPGALAGPTLVWTFSPGPGSEARADVSIPYDGGAGPVRPAQARVDVYDAFASNDGATLIIEVSVRNVGDSPLPVNVRDIVLSSSAGTSELVMAAPPLPWTIEPGQAREVELVFEKPDAPAAVLMLLGFSFEIGGLE